jgi:hypothetical protein
MRARPTIASFGKDGRVDLQAALIRRRKTDASSVSCPPMIVGNWSWSAAWCSIA